jgi:sulfide:quinone oxidoreductase
MPSGVMGKTVAAESIVDRIKQGPSARPTRPRWPRMGAACVASAGTGLRTGSAAAMTMMPIVPDFEKYRTGRDLSRHPWRDRARGALGQAHAAPPLHPQGQGPGGLGWQFIPE